MDVIKCCMIIGWTYLVLSSLILFASDLEWLVTKITRRNIFIIIFLCSFHKGITTKKVKAHVISRKCLLQDKSSSLGNLLIALKLVKWFPLQHQPLCTYLKILIMRFVIFMINICIYNHPFKVFMNRKHKGFEDLVCAMLERLINS